MIIQMILRQIRKHRRIELDSGHAILIQRMRRYFHDYIIHASVPHDGQRVLKLNNIRRRIVDRKYLLLHHDLNRTDQADLISRMAKDCPRDIARCRLAIRSGNADYTHTAGGIIVKIWNHSIQSRPKLRHQQDSHPVRHLDIAARRQNRTGSGSSRLPDKLVSIDMNARNANE